MIKKLLCFFGFHATTKRYDWPIGYTHKECKRCKYHKLVKDEAGYYKNVIQKS